MSMSVWVFVGARVPRGSPPRCWPRPPTVSSEKEEPAQAPPTKHTNRTEEAGSPQENSSMWVTTCIFTTRPFSTGLFSYILILSHIHSFMDSPAYRSVYSTAEIWLKLKPRVYYTFAVFRFPLSRHFYILDITAATFLTHQHNTQLWLLIPSIEPLMYHTYL